IRRALILSLGEFGAEAWSAGGRNILVRKMQQLYQTADDPGLHAAAEWLLRHWKQEPWLKQTDEQWAKDNEQRQQRLAGSKQGSPQWYVNGQGQSMVLIPGPKEFVMGSPPTEEQRTSDESQHHRRINRTFALAAKSVTKEQFLRFLPKFSHDQMH